MIADGVKGARFSGFRILADAAMPLSARHSADGLEVEIDDVEVKGAGIGIEIRGAASPRVRANSIRDARRGHLDSGAGYAVALAQL